MVEGVEMRGLGLAVPALLGRARGYSAKLGTPPPATIFAGAWKDCDHGTASLEIEHAQPALNWPMTAKIEAERSGAPS